MIKINHPCAFRIYGGKFNIEESKASSGNPFLLMNSPYYLGTQLPGYIEYLVNSYSPK